MSEQIPTPPTPERAEKEPAKEPVSGVRKRPETNTDTEADMDARKRSSLIRGTTRRIIELVREERDLLRQIREQDQVVQRLEDEYVALNPIGALGFVKSLLNHNKSVECLKKITQIKRSLNPLKQKYLNEYVRVRGKEPWGEGRSWGERLKRAEAKLAKQKALLKTAPARESASDR